MVFAAGFDSDQELLAVMLGALGWMSSFVAALMAAALSLARVRNRVVCALGLAGGAIAFAATLAVVCLAGIVLRPWWFYPVLLSPVALGALAVRLSYRPGREGDEGIDPMPDRAAIERAAASARDRFSRRRDTGERHALTEGPASG